MNTYICAHIASGKDSDFRIFLESLMTLGLQVLNAIAKFNIII